MSRRYFAVLTAIALAIFAVPFLARADGASFKNYSRTGSVTLGSRPLTGASLGAWDPAVSGSIDTGYIDTSGCAAGCLAALVEVETATTTASCSTFGSYDSGGYSTLVSSAKLIGSAVTVNASSFSWGNSVCAGAATSGAAIQAPLPKYVRLYCAAVAGVNMRAFMSCH